MTTAELIALLFRVGITLGVMAGVCVGLALLFRRRSDDKRHRAFFRGSCRDCGYNPATATRTCPECAGAVLDLRLFRPIGAEVSDATDIGVTDPDATDPDPSDPGSTIGPDLVARR